MNWNKLTLRYLALGFFASAVLLSGYGLIASPDSTPEQQAQEESVPDTSVSSDSSDMVDLTENSSSEKVEETEEVEEDSSAEADTSQSEETEEETDTSEETTDTLSAVIVIEEGDPSSVASSQLQNQGIIESATEFNDFLEENNYITLLRPGSYEVNSDMTFQEIAEILMSEN